MSAFEGKNWYEIARYNDDFEGSEDCTIMTFKEENGVVLFNVRSTANNDIRNFGGSVDLRANKDGVMYYHSRVFNGESDNTIPTIIMAVDYNSYAVLYFCMIDEKTKKKTDMAWILSTTKTLNAEAKTAIENLFQANKIIDKSRFVWEKFTNAACKGDV
ncbi:bilin-binding protein-like [Aricia agestis]|uniref:bilin-binding protein-like n=1 Tax=Aricia agestis TaxID=91739 RepID=UPI001C202DFC|nr:bilin-binding protein-like [Aricia agestis]